MDNINILIIEDDIHAAMLLKTVLERNGYTVTGIGRNYKEALTLFYNVAVDLVIIDVFLGENPEGVAFAETISTVPKSLKPFLFLTSCKDRQIFQRAKLTMPFRFLLKPFNELEILYAIEMAIEKFYEQTNVFASRNQNTVIGKDYLFIKKKNVLKKVTLSSILYIKVENRYCNIITEDEKFLIQISLNKVLDYLDLSIFRQIHRKYVVNINAIEQIYTSDNLLLLKKNHKITFSSKYKEVLNHFAILK